nr:integrase, catalytic region, zinc finger, CCHC-type, peptidase aspartic, catalytic [Tanacetum cinerariifolium]
MPTQTIPMLSKRPMIASNDIHKTGLGLSNLWFSRKAQLSQPTLYDGHRLLQPSHAPVTVSDSYETLLETEVSRMKMSQKPGYVTPVDYTKLNAMYDQFVPQKELSREQVYWLSASDIASQSSDPLKPVTPFVHTRPMNNICSIVLASVNIVPPVSDCMCAELRTSCDREHNRVLELEAEISKLHNMLKESKKRVFIQKDHIDLQVKFQNFKECANSNATPSNVIFEINKLKDQLQERDETIRNLKSQFNISRMLKIGSPVELSKVSTHSRNTSNEKIAALNAEIAKMKPSGSGTKVSGPKTPEKPKVLAPGMYAIRLTPAAEVVQIVLWYLDSGCSRHMTGDRSKLINYVEKFVGTVRFRNGQFATIVRYGDYKIGDTIISRVYYVEGLSHNLFSVGQFCDGGLEVAFRQHTCHIGNMDNVDLLQGSRTINLYSISLNDMLSAFPVCLLTKASSTKSWLWHHRLNHLNF